MRLYSFSVPIRIPSKKNRYRVHQNPKTGRRWIAPAADVVAAELAVAWCAKQAISRELGRVVVLVEIDQRNDVDNVLGAIFDGLEKSGRLGNDRQIEAAMVIRGGDGCHVVVADLDPHEGARMALADLLTADCLHERRNIIK